MREKCTGAYEILVPEVTVNVKQKYVMNQVVQAKVTKNVSTLLNTPFQCKVEHVLLQWPFSVHVLEDKALCDGDGPTATFSSATGLRLC